MKNYGNKVLHCGVTRTGTTVIRHVFEKLVERFDLDILKNKEKNQYWVGF